MWMEGTIRTLNPDVRAYYIDRVEAIVKNIAEAMRCECSVEWPEGVPVVLNDSEFTSLVEDSAKIVLGEEYVSDSMKPSMGNEDFAQYQERVPGTLVFLNIANVQKNTCVPLHNPSFQIDEDVLWHGVALNVQVAMDYLV